MNEKLNIDIKTLRPFTKFIYTIGELPTSYLMSMTYEEQLVWLCNYLSKTVIPTINNNAEAVKEVQDLVLELQDYINNYFDNLDVQEEINNKLDEMVEDGTLERILTLYPILDNEIGVSNIFFEYGDIKRYGGICDGITDDKNALNNAITNAITYNFPVKIHGIIYVSETINTHGVYIVGDKQPTESGVLYPDDVGYNYAKNVGNGANITFSDYINKIPNGTCIVSDIANPILSTNYNERFNLENFGVYGWLRNNSQEGLLVNTAPDGITYYPGGHKFTNFSVFNTGNNAIHLHSLETSIINNLKIELCNGYGLYIEGLNNIDTPFDYNKFINCKFAYTRLSAIYLYNTYRQNNEFNHCNFNFIGQHDFGQVNDIYGDRIQPNSNDSIIYAITVDGLNSSNANQCRNLNLRYNYGEQTNGLLNLYNIETIQGLNLFSNAIIKSRNSTNSCYIRIRSNYIFNLDIDETNSNVETYYDINDISQLRSSGFLPYQFTSTFSNINKILKDNNKEGIKAYRKLYGTDINSKHYLISTNNYYYYNTSSGNEQTVTIDIKETVDTYFKENWSTIHGQPFTLALLSISNGGNTTEAPKCDLIAITRHNNNHLVSFITNNTGATATAQGIISITVPPYKIATLQFVQEVETGINN